MIDGPTTGATRSAVARPIGERRAPERRGPRAMLTLGINVIGRGLRVVARGLRYATRTAFRPDIVTIGGTRVQLPASASPLMRDVIYRENFGRAEVQAISATLRRGDVVVDMGSGIGFVGVNMARIVGVRNLHLIEANRDLVPCIRRNFSLNGLEAPIIHHGVASADAAADHAAFNVSRDFWTSSAETANETQRQEKVPVIDVNRLIREHRASVVLMDIEGSEFDLVPRCDVSGLRAFIVEVHPVSDFDRKLHAMFKSLVDRGFVVETMIDHNLYVFKRAL
jgi:FkbM family methyltransferase